MFLNVDSLEKYTLLYFSLSLLVPGNVGTMTGAVATFMTMYAGQEATVRTGHGTTDWLQIGKRVCQGCILSPCLFNLYAEYIMRNAGLEFLLGKSHGRRNLVGYNPWGGKDSDMIEVN